MRTLAQYCKFRMTLPRVHYSLYDFNFIMYEKNKMLSQVIYNGSSNLCSLSTIWIETIG